MAKVNAMILPPTAEADADADADDALALHDMFADPPDYYPPTPPPTSQIFTLASGPVLTLHLVGHSALEGHLLWNGSKAVSRFLEDHPDSVAGGNVLELGAGAGLPSLVCASLGARRVVVTDYPDVDLLENMQRNVDLAEEALVGVSGGGGEGSGSGSGSGSWERRVRVRGYIWGRDTEPLLRLIQGDDDEEEEGEEEEKGENNSVRGGNLGDQYYNYHGLPPPTSSSKPTPYPRQKFDAIIMTDLLFRHCEHANLLLTIRSVLRRVPSAAAYVFFTSHRPWLLHADLAFFELAQMREHGGFAVEKVLERELDVPLFRKEDIKRRRRVETEEKEGEEEGEGEEDEEVRETVTGWVVRWREGDWDEEEEEVRKGGA